MTRSAFSQNRPIRELWRNQVIEPTLEPALPIIDAHIHIWAKVPPQPFEPYPPERAFAEKLDSAHNVIATVYVDSHDHYRTEGPEPLRVVGETEFAEQVAEESLRRGGRAGGMCAAIVSNADLTLGPAVGDVLDAHIAASSRFRGVRHSTAYDVDMPPMYNYARGAMARPEFREGFRELARRALTFDATLFHPQIPELIDLVRQFPDTKIILDHLGGPIGIGRYANKQKQAFAEWRQQMAELSRNPNVSVKLGGLNMIYTGMDANNSPRPNTSKETAYLQRDHILAAIDLFGPDRCMFESNFPVDKTSISYNLLWNSFKRITSALSPAERGQLFAGTADRIYRLELMSNLFENVK